MTARSDLRRRPAGNLDGRRRRLTMHATNSRSTGSRRSCEPRPQIVPAGHDRDRTESPVNTSTSPAPISARWVVLPGLVKPEGLVIETGPVAAPGPGQLLVAVEATGISYAEQAMRRGRYFGQPEFPFVPGYDLVGTVLQAGPQADTSLAGKRVAVLTKTGGWASHAVVEARDTVIVPAGIDPADAETVVVNGVTAWQLLHRAARVKPGQTILVHGASGAVGGVLIQLAQHARIRVIGAASPRHHDALRAAGVEPVDYHDPKLADHVRELSPGASTRCSTTSAGP
jgi:NADPH:quinone reductase-like Zn-dependent oxidoreductase